MAAYTVGQSEINRQQEAAYKKGSGKGGKGGKGSKAPAAEPMTPDMIRALAKKA